MDSPTDRAAGARPALVRRFYEAFSAGDLPTLLDSVDPQIEFEPVLGVLYSRHVYRGHDGIVQWFEELQRAWDAFDSEVTEAFEVGERVVAFVRLTAHRGEDSLAAEIAVECAFKGDRISSFTGRDAGAVADELGVPPPH